MPPMPVMTNRFCLHRCAWVVVAQGVVDTLYKLRAANEQAVDRACVSTSMFKVKLHMTYSYAAVRYSALCIPVKAKYFYCTIGAI